MKKFIFSAMSAIALMGVSANANAATYSPTGSWTITGTVSTYLGALGPFSCPITINATTTSSSMSVSSITMGGTCSVATLNSVGPVSYAGGTGTGTLTLAVDASGPFGIRCAGTLVGDWNNGPAPTLYLDDTLPGVGSSGSCRFKGTLTASSTGGTPYITNP